MWLLLYIFREPPVRQHLKNVYGTLMMTCASATAGVYVDIYTSFQAGFLSAIIGAGLMLMLIATPDTGKNTSQRLGYLLGFGLTSGNWYLIFKIKLLYYYWLFELLFYKICIVQVSNSTIV